MVLYLPKANLRKKKEKYCFAFDEKKGKTKVNSKRLKSYHELIKLLFLPQVSFQATSFDETHGFSKKS